MADPLVTQPIVKVTIDEAKLAQVQAAIGQIRGGTDRVFSRAINRTMSSARVRIAREISAGIRMGVRKVQSRIYLRRATRAKLVGFLGLSAAEYDLVKTFDAQYTRGEGVDVQVLKDRRTFLPRAFMVSGIRAGLGWQKNARGWWGFRRVLMRKPTSGQTPTWDSGDMGRLVGRLPVMKVRGPSLAQLWEQAPDMVAKAVEYSQHTLEKNVDDQVKLLLKESFDPVI
jgi:hypothetical protein